MTVTRLPSGTFYGRQLRTFDVAGFRLTESAYAAGAVLPRHAHARAHFNFVIAGAYQERLGRQELTRRRSSLLFLPSGLPHEQTQATNGRDFMIEVDDAYLARFARDPADLSAPLDLSGGEGRRLALRMYQEFSSADDLSHLVLEGLGLELLALTIRRRQRSERRPPPWLLRVRDRLESTFAEPFALADLARSEGVHPVHLAQAFRRWFGCTVGEFVRELRLNDACDALTASDASLADIALAAGFADQSHLCRVFRRLKGMSPRTYQRVARRTACAEPIVHKRIQD